VGTGGTRVRSERRGMAGTRRTRAVLSLERFKHAAIVCVAADQAYPPDVPLGHRCPAHICGALFFEGMHDSGIWLALSIPAAIAFSTIQSHDPFACSRMPLQRRSPRVSPHRWHRYEITFSGSDFVRLRTVVTVSMIWPQRSQIGAGYWIAR
jgi:hypothetical protein